MALHMLACKRPLCSCGSYTYPHRPLSGMCALNPDAQVALALRAGTAGDDLLDLAAEVAFFMPGKPAKECPF
jgi:hypothetical protein